MGVNSEKSKLFTKIKNLKNISKTFQKPIDILIFMCYNIRAVRGTPRQKKERNNMKKYAVIDWKNGDSFEDIFDTEQEALEAAEYQWNHLTKSEQQKREFFAVMHGEIDEDGCFDLDTAELVKAYK